MLVRCEKCWNLMDLRTNAAVLSFILGSPVKCDICKKEIFYVEEKKK